MASGATAGEDFRMAMRHLVAGVVMVTTDIDGRPWGLTISACCSLSADPPQVLVSLGTATVSARRIAETRRFGLSLLTTDHRGLADVGAAPGAPKFVDEHCVDDARHARPPRVRGALFHLDCEVVDVTCVADHSIFVGRVLETFSGREARSSSPLIYFDREYHAVGAGVA